ncbi:MAG: sigma-70 family RNA polymerase sigma factor [Anaerolineaceae bacterium]
MQISKLIDTPLDIPPDKDAESVFAAQRNPAEFQQIYDRWAVPVYQYFYFRTDEPASAEDLTSQLFLSAYQALPRYQHRGHFAAWLFTIARNLSNDYFRKNHREVPLEAAQQLFASSDPSTEAAQHDEIIHLRELVQSLPEEDQELIRLRYVANLTFSDMAIVLKKREDAVKKSLYRLQARLQSLLEQNHD